MQLAAAPSVQAVVRHLLLPVLILATGCATTSDLSAPPRANLSALISSADYPVAALRAEQQGTVEFRLDVSAEGRVTGCTITSSSGSSALDSATCSLLVRRARFTPALDRQGRPTTGTVESRIRWAIPIG